MSFALRDADAIGFVDGISLLCRHLLPIHRCRRATPTAALRVTLIFGFCFSHFAVLEVVKMPGANTVAALIQFFVDEMRRGACTEKLRADVAVWLRARSEVATVGGDALARIP